MRPAVTVDGLARNEVPLVGRHGVVELFDDRLKAARACESSVVLLRGEAGVGKTRLLHELVDAATLRGFQVLFGSAHPHTRGVAYGALLGALSSALDDETSSQLSPTVERLRLALDHRNDDNSIDRSLADDAASIQEVHAAFRRLTRSWADRGPVLLAVDDLHAADQDTVALVSLLAHGPRDSRLLIASTFRSDFPALGLEFAAFVEDLERRPRTHVVDVDPIDVDDARALIASHLGGPPSEDLLHDLMEMTKGNPFYLDSLLQACEEAQSLVRANGCWQLRHRAQFPRLSRSSALLYRVFSLGHDARVVARALTVFQTVSLDRTDLLAEICGMPGERVEAAVDTLVRARILTHVEGRRFQFSYPIVATTLGDDLGPNELKRVHATIVAYLRRHQARDIPVPISELAFHVAESAAPGDEEAASVLAAAGDAVATTAPRSAADWYQRAQLLLPEGSAERGPILARHARALYLAQRKAEAGSVAEEALALLPEGVERARAAGVRAECLRAAGRVDEALVALEEELVREPRNTRLLGEHAQLLVEVDQFASAEIVAKEALDGAAETHATRAPPLIALAAAAYAQGRNDDAITLLEEATDAARDLSPVLRLGVLAARGSYLAYGGDCPRAELALASAERLSADLGGQALWTYLNPAMVWLLGLQGRWDECLDRIRASTPEYARSGELQLLWIVQTMACWIALERGQVEQARHLATKLGETCSTRSGAAWARSGVELAIGRVDDARETAGAAVDRDHRSGRLSVVPQLLVRLIDIELASGDETAAADRLCELDESVTRMQPSPWSRCQVERARALVTKDVEHARRSVELAEHHGLTFEAAVSTLVLGELDQDTSALRAAHDGFWTLEAEPWRRRAAGDLRALGVTVPRRARALGGTLTQTECQLAKLVTEGFTNKEIANALHFSPKTVEVYLSRLYGKVDCASRVELAVAVAEGRVPIADDTWE